MNAHVPPTAPRADGVSALDGDPRSAIPPTGKARRRLLVVVFADIVGFTATMSADEEAAIGLARLLHALVDDAAEVHGIVPVKSLGDGTLFYGESATASFAAAMELAERFGQRSREMGIPALLRIGMHLGEITIAEDGDVFGEGVNLAARLEAAARPGTILITESTWRLVRGRDGVDAVPLPPMTLKGIDGTVGVVEIGGHVATAAGRPAPRARQPDPSTVAVLPFRFVGANDEASFLAVGIHNDLLTELARVPNITVIAKTSVLAYEGRSVPAQQIARDLNAAFLVEGTVQAAGDRIRLTIHLTDGTTGFQRWADHLDRELTTAGLFDIQTDITHHIVTSLGSQLAPPRRASSTTGSSDLESYRLVVEARMQFDRKTEEGFSAAADLFRRALEVDPDHGPAWSGLAEALALAADYGYGDTARLLAEAKGAVARAMELMPDDPAPHTALGLIAEAEHDAPRALREYEFVIAANPGHPDAHSWHAWMSLIAGLPDQAAISARRAVELNPLSAEAVTNLALSALALGKADDALSEARRAALLSPGYTTPTYYEAIALYDLGRFDEAVAALFPLSIVATGGLSTPWAGAGPDVVLAAAQVHVGDLDAARRTVESIDPATFPFEHALGRLALGEVAEASAFFDRIDTMGYGPVLLHRYHLRDVWEPGAAGPVSDRLDRVAARSWRMPVQR